MSAVTDEYMYQMRSTAREYCIVILTKGPNINEEGADKIIWEHGRRNHELRASGVLAIVCPVNDGSEVAGIGIFTTSVEETEKIMVGDPAVEAGVLTYEIHACWSFPGDHLPQK